MKVVVIKMNMMMIIAMIMIMAVNMIKVNDLGNAKNNNMNHNCYDILLLTVVCITAMHVNTW